MLYSFDLGSIYPVLCSSLFSFFGQKFRRVPAYCSFVPFDYFKYKFTPGLRLTFKQRVWFKHIHFNCFVNGFMKVRMDMPDVMVK